MAVMLAAGSGGLSTIAFGLAAVPSFSVPRYRCRGSIRLPSRAVVLARSLARLPKTMKLVGFAATTNPATAKQFYGDALDLSLVEDGPFALVFDANGTMLRVQKVKSLAPAQHTILGWE